MKKINLSIHGNAVGPESSMPPESTNWGTRYVADDGKYLVINDQLYFCIDIKNTETVGDIEEIDIPPETEQEAKARAWDIITGEGN